MVEKRTRRRTTTEIQTPDPLLVAPVPERTAWFRRLAFLAPTSPVPTIAGVLVVAAGFVLIAIAWSNVAGETSVALQLPYLVSAGITGLALVMVGLLVVNIAVKRQEGAERRQQMDLLAEILQDLKRSLDK